MEQEWDLMKSEPPQDDGARTAMAGPSSMERPSWDRRNCEDQTDLVKVEPTSFA